MKFQSPWMGRVKGSAGNMTGCKIYDKNVMRAKAFEVSNPRTPAQVTQRNFFASVTALSSDFSNELLRTLFPQKPKTMSRRNMLSKQIAENYEVEGTVKSIDFSTIDTLGNAPVMDFGETTVTPGQSAIAIVLDDAVKNLAQFADNYFFCALVNETKGEIVVPITSAKVSTGTISPEYPSGWDSTDTIHAIPFITDSKVALAGFGTMGVTERPARSN